MSLWSTIRKVRTGYRCTKFIVGIFCCNIAYILSLIFAFILPISAFSSRPGLAGLFALPLVPQSLLINESKWILHGVKDRRNDVPVVRERGGLMIITCVFVASVIVVNGILLRETFDLMAQPIYTQPYDGNYNYAAYLGIATQTCGALASLLLSS